MTDAFPDTPGDSAPETLALVDAVLRLVATDAPLPELSSALSGLVDIALADCSTSLFVTGSDAPDPPLGGEPHVPLVRAAVDRAVSTGDRFTLHLPGGPWSAAWVTPVAGVDPAECVGVLVVWSARAGEPPEAATVPVERATRLTSIALSGHPDAVASRRAARVDPLTGLANRRHFESALADISDEAGHVPCAVLLLDLEDFAAVNAQNGPDAADHVLVIVGERLRGALRARDLVARWGGDEFAVLCRDVVDEVEAQHVAARLQRVIGQAMVVDEASLTITARVGVGFAARGDEALMLVDEARAALAPR
jgi:diguanylate cyclase (GGDEF)-like protein